MSKYNLFCLFTISLLVISCKPKSSDPSAELIESTSAQAEVISNLSVDEANILIKSNPHLVIIDVRTPREVAEGKIDGALEMDVHAPDFANKISSLNKDAEYLLYCKVGGRSAHAADIMEKDGFKRIYNMVGGYDGWKSAVE